MNRFHSFPGGLQHRSATVFVFIEPGLSIEKLIDYNTACALKQWTAKKPGETLFVGSPQNLNMFLERLSSKVVIEGWKSFFKISGKDLLTYYGTIHIEDVRTASKGYFTLDEDGELEVDKMAQTFITDVNLYSSIYYF